MKLLSTISACLALALGPAGSTAAEINDVGRTCEWTWSASQHRGQSPTQAAYHLGSFSCCQGMRGNVDYDPMDDVNVSDLTTLVAYLFAGAGPPPCPDEANIDGTDGPGGPIDVGDVTYLVAYLFTGGPEPPLCQDDTPPEFEDVEAELAALWLAGALTAPVALYEQIYEELLSIRTIWTDSVPNVSIGFIPPWEPSKILLGVTDATYDSILAGTYHHWDDLNALYGLDSFYVGFGQPGFCSIRLVFSGNKNPDIMAPNYALLPGVRYAEPNHLCCDYPLLLLYQDGDAIVYFFRNAWGDCPAGCIYDEIDVFAFQNGEPVHLGLYDSHYEMPPPYGFMYMAAWSEYWH